MQLKNQVHHPFNAIITVFSDTTAISFFTITTVSTVNSQLFTACTGHYFTKVDYVDGVPEVTWLLRIDNHVVAI